MAPDSSGFVFDRDFELLEAAGEEEDLRAQDLNLAEGGGVGFQTIERHSDHGVVAFLPQFLAAAKDGLLRFVIEVASEIPVGGEAREGEQRDDKVTREGLLALNATRQILICAHEFFLLLLSDAGAEDYG